MTMDTEALLLDAELAFLTDTAYTIEIAKAASAMAAQIDFLSEHYSITKEQAIHLESLDGADRNRLRQHYAERERKRQASERAAQDPQAPKTKRVVVNKRVYALRGCDVPECTEKHEARGLCVNHYGSFRYYVKLGLTKEQASAHVLSGRPFRREDYDL